MSEPSTTEPAPEPAPPQTPTHIYDAVSAQRDRVLGGFAGQREALVRAVREQRLAAMPERLKPSPRAQAGVELVQALQQFISREVTRQVDVALAALAARGLLATNPDADPAPSTESHARPGGGPGM